MLTFNETQVEEFLLLGFQNLNDFQIPVFLIILLIYMGTVTGNVLIILLVSISHQLHSPMYYFLCHLSLCDILISTNVAPNTLQIILVSRSPISVRGCIIQLYFFGASAIIECCLLTVMSYDRYLAICNPLRYVSIMNIRLPHYLAIWCWLAGFLLSLITHILLLKLQFCGPRMIDHFFCDLSPLLELSCSDISAVQAEVSLMAILISFLQFLFVLISYISIVKSILNISTATGRSKAFSTCSSHLLVVFVYYGSMTSLYIAPSTGLSLSLNKVLSLLNTVFTPLLNPIIYSLRNKEIRQAAHKFR